MKARLAILMAGLIFLATPMMALAHGGDRHNDGPRYSNGWVKEQHAADHYRQNYRHKSQHKQWKKQQIRKQVRKEVRRELRHQPKARPYYVQNQRPHRVNVHPAAVLLGLPHLVFNIDW